MNDCPLPLLPPKKDLETKQVLKKTALAHRRLAELKEAAKSIPNQAMLINMLTLQEAKDSSAIENIITTHDELYKTTLFSNRTKNPKTKEVYGYTDALYKVYKLVTKNKILNVSHMLEIHEILEKNDAGIRKLPGTKIKNDHTGEVIYTPPQDHKIIMRLMDNLELFINDDSIYDVDHLIKMAIIHLQFESIHPFYDGNGRVGRIINILYLVIKDLLDLPILYLSRYFIKTKPEYYRLLQESRVMGDWEPWVIYILEGIESTSLQTTSLINEIKKIMLDYKHKIRSDLPKIYSQDLINNLFQNPYTKIEYLTKDLQVSRATATKYLNQLTEAKLLQKRKDGRYNYYINTPLVGLFYSMT